ncbi:MAG: hypothetical protein HC936_08325 [Leptolyngbyaceae cyanobacterium SU_3_3]|nr:hypothetical protein [Leptolyngbyaceae cyanobacterium SU_3_3]NJR50430.1 hypothetical protein [Leptolyngbyaceae cyanobacterium CSU_1_3]
MRLKLSLILSCILTTTIVCTHSLTARADDSYQTREAAIDRQADWFLYNVNPKLQGRKLRSNDAQYIKEWNAIRKAVAREMKSTISSCGGAQYWELVEYDWLYGSSDLAERHVSSSFDRIANAIFYSRHPKLAGTQISSSNSALAREWSHIRRSIITEQPCS